MYNGYYTTFWIFQAYTRGDLRLWLKQKENKICVVSHDAKEKILSLLVVEWVVVNFIPLNVKSFCSFFWKHADASIHVLDSHAWEELVWPRRRCGIRYIFKSHTIGICAAHNSLRSKCGIAPKHNCLQHLSSKSLKHLFRISSFSIALAKE